MLKFTSDNKLTADKVKNWDDARKLLREWRDENIRNSLDIVELWERVVAQNINRFGDEKWLVYEQVYIAALDTNNQQIADNCIAALKTQYPKSTRVKKLAGMKFESIGKFSKAQSIYKEILEDDKTNAHASKRQIACLKSQNKIKEYTKALNDYLLVYQADQEAWLELCDVYLNELEYSKAAFCLEELILMHPYNHVYHQKFADIKYTQGNYELARSYYAMALKLNPNNVRALYGILLATTNLKSSQKAKDASENARLASSASEQLKSLYSNQKTPEQSGNSIEHLFKYLSIGKN